MLTAQYHPFTRKLWDGYIHYIIKKGFHQMRWEAKAGFLPAAGQSLLVMANHFSWWDGFWVYELNRRFFKKRFHVMMLAQELAPRQALRHLGAYSIDKTSPRSMVATLDYTASLLANPGNMVLMFPQGQIESLYCEAPSFQKGIWRILQRCKTAPVQTLACINTIDYMAERKPSVHMHLTPCPAPASFEDLRKAFCHAYAHARQQQGGIAI